MDKQITTITSIKSSDDLRTYLEEHTQLNLSLMKDKSEATLLHYSAFKNDIVKMKLYLQHYKAYCELTHGRGMYMNQAGFQSKLRAWINSANKQGLTPVHFAALHGNIQMIKLLQQLGANMQYKTKQQENVMFMCVQNNQLKTLMFLLSLPSLKIDLNEQNHLGDNILHKSAKNGYILLTSYLLTTSINKDAKNKQGWTPLMQATIAGSKEVVKRLLLKGADRHVKNNDGKTAIQLAQQQGKNELVNILNDDFTCGQQIKIACNIKIVYRVQKPSYLYSIFFIILFHIVFVPTCVLTEFSILPPDISYISTIGQAFYYVVVIIMYFLLLKKQPKKRPAPLQTISMPFCPECKSQTKNQFHCFTCDRCVYRYDHHCPWINNCIGGFNIGKFYAFLWLVQLGAIFVIFCHTCIMLDLIDTIIEYRTFVGVVRQQQVAISIFALLIALFFGLSIMMLIIQQTNNLTTNTTSFQRAKKKQLPGSSISSSSNKLSSTMLSNSSVQLNQSLNQQHKIQQYQQDETACCKNCSLMLYGERIQ